ncbi:hypothetical protein HYH02_012202 [Chlamydomonas schloesseri]|uniref:Glutaredoxin domain-containing protein n=1 Tax=Chlamydomonas schloesseri TaxID=2026947 RepID=A0A835T8U5_9CHLO|nr:hypothetical protein HYH02_012202 [Chlamydomonas schloesseri]|eukprot:KAG2434535.1 hypothetical protein HYH02_012202 [Chlamydomonas schloesseri]
MVDVELGETETGPAASALKTYVGDSLEARLKAAVACTPVVVFGRRHCPFSVEALRVLSQALGGSGSGSGGGARPHLLSHFATDEMEGGVAVEAALRRLTGAHPPRPPYVYVNKQMVGGCEEVTRLARDGELGRLLAAAGIRAAPTSATLAAAAAAAATATGAATPASNSTNTSSSNGGGGGADSVPSIGAGWVMPFIGYPHAVDKRLLRCNAFWTFVTALLICIYYRNTAAHWVMGGLMVDSVLRLGGGPSFSALGALSVLCLTLLDFVGSRPNFVPGGPRQVAALLDVAITALSFLFFLTADHEGKLLIVGLSFSCLLGALCLVEAATGWSAAAAAFEAGLVRTGLLPLGSVYGCFVTAAQEAEAAYPYPSRRPPRRRTIQTVVLSAAATAAAAGARAAGPESSVMVSADPIDVQYKVKTPGQDWNPIKHCGIGLTVIPFGLAGLAGAWKSADPGAGLGLDAPAAPYYAIAILAAIVYCSWLVAYGLKMFLYPRRVLREAADPVAGHLFTLPFVVACLFALAVKDRDPTFARVLYWMGAPAILLLSLVWVAGWFSTRYTLEQFNTAWMLMPVVNFVPAAVGPLVDPTYRDATQAWFAFAFAFWVIITVISTHKAIVLFDYDEGARSLMAIWVAAPSVGAVAYATNFGFTTASSSFGPDNDLVFICMHWLAVLMALVLGLCFLRGHLGHASTTFNMSYWGYGFPTTALSMCCTIYYTLKPGEFSQAVAYAALFATSYIHACLLLQTAALLVRGGVFQPAGKWGPLLGWLWGGAHPALGALLPRAVDGARAAAVAADGASLEAFRTTWAGVCLAARELLRQEAAALYPALAEAVGPEAASGVAAAERRAAGLQAQLEGVSSKLAAAEQLLLASTSSRGDATAAAAAVTSSSTAVPPAPPAAAAATVPTTSAVTDPHHVSMVVVAGPKPHGHGGLLSIPRAPGSSSRSSVSTAALPPPPPPLAAPSNGADADPLATAAAATTPAANGGAGHKQQQQQQQQQSKDSTAATAAVELLLGGLCADVEAVAAGLADHLAAEATHLAPLARKYLPLKTSKQVVRKMWEATPPAAWAALLPLLVEAAPGGTAARSAMVRALLWVLDSRPAVLGLMLARRLPLAQWRLLAGAVPQLLPRGAGVRVWQLARKRSGVTPQAHQDWPGHEFAIHWARPDPWRALSLPQRKRLLCLAASSCHAPSLEAALAQCGCSLSRSRALDDALSAAALVGNLPGCKRLLLLLTPQETGGAATVKGAAGGGSQPQQQQKSSYRAPPDSAISTAAAFGQLQVLGFLLELKKDVSSAIRAGKGNVVCRRTLQTRLCEVADDACRGGRLEVLEWLAAHYGYVLGFQELVKAAGAGQVGLMRALMDKLLLQPQQPMQPMAPPAAAAAAAAAGMHFDDLWVPLASSTAGNAAWVGPVLPTSLWPAITDLLVAAITSRTACWEAKWLWLLSHTGADEGQQGPGGGGGGGGGAAGVLQRMLIDPGRRNRSAALEAACGPLPGYCQRLRVLHAAGMRPSEGAAEWAVQGGHADALLYLWHEQEVPCLASLRSFQALVMGQGGGKVPVLNLLQEQGVPFTAVHVRQGAQGGWPEASLMWLLALVPESQSVPAADDLAATGGGGGGTSGGGSGGANGGGGRSNSPRNEAAGEQQARRRQQRWRDESTGEATEDNSARAQGVVKPGSFGTATAVAGANKPAQRHSMDGSAASVAQGQQGQQQQQGLAAADQEVDQQQQPAAEGHPQQQPASSPAELRREWSQAFTAAARKAHSRQLLQALVDRGAAVDLAAVAEAGSEDTTAWAAELLRKAQGGGELKALCADAAQRVAESGNKATLAWLRARRLVRKNF